MYSRSGIATRRRRTCGLECRRRRRHPLRHPGEGSVLGSFERVAWSTSGLGPGGAT